MSHIKTPLKEYVVHRPKLQSCKRYISSVATLATILVVGLVLTTGVVSAQELGYRLTRIKEPVKAPDFQLQDMDEKLYSLADYRGKVIMINFWATWCPPCRQEMPSLEAVYQDLKEDGFMVIAINQWESPELVFPYIGQLSVFPTFPILFDHDGKLSQTYDVKGLPTTFIVDKQGNIVYRAIGGRDFNHPEVKKLIRALL